MMFKPCSILASTLLLSLVASAAFAADIIEVTDYHGEELHAKSGSTWMGLFPTKAGQFELRPTKVNIAIVRDEITDDPAGPKTGKKVTAAGKVAPLFLLDGVPALKAGKVSTSKTYQKEHPDIGFKTKLNVGAKESTLTVSGTKKDSEWRNQYKIVLETEGVKQTVYERKEVSDSSFPSLLWAGDLDGDGKLDLIMDMTNNYNVRDVTLFLSTKAKQGKLVEKIVSHVSTGC
ncbi:MAG: hypothetical protein K2Y39_18970 [Candidatus Obscuribacterales bacterium]|nr:hypothetical protein [Candidatus Obscuribacterales bacterium]